MAGRTEPAADSSPVDDDPLVIEVDAVPELVRALQPLCDLGYICDFTLRDGTEASAVLVGISSTALILDRWDDLRHRPAGDPFVLELAAVRRVVVP